MTMHTPSTRRHFLQTTTGAVLLGAARFACGVDEPAALAIDDETARVPLVTRSAPVTYRGQHTATVQLGSSQPESLEVWLPVPMSWKEQQVSNITVSPMTPVRPSITGPVNVAHWLWQPGSRRPPAELTFSVSYDWNRSSVQTDISRLMSDPYVPYDQQSKSYRQFTRPEAKVQSRSKDIQAIAARTARPQRPWGEVALDLYEWVIDQTEYANINWKGAQWCLDNRTGACGDYSALFVALCRASGIPARLNIGYWADETNGYHVWAEFMEPHGEWIPVDPSIGDQGGNSRSANFGFLDARRITVAKYADVRLNKKDPESRKADLLQIGSWWYTSRTNEAPQVSYKFVGEAVNASAE